LAVSTTAIDLAPIINPIISLAGTVLMGVASWALAKVAQLAGLGQQTALKQAVLDGVQRAITYAESQVGQKVSNGVPVDVHNAVVATAANYLITKFPGYIAKLGWTPQAISDLVVAHLPPPVPAG